MLRIVLASVLLLGSVHAHRDDKLLFVPVRVAGARWTASKRPERPFTFRDSWGPAIPSAAIGMEMFRRFTTTFDVAHGKLYLQPNRRLTEPVPPPGR